MGFDWRCADILFPLKPKNEMIGKKKKYSLSLTLVMVFIAAVNVSLTFPDLRDKIVVLYSIWGARDIAPKAGS